MHLLRTSLRQTFTAHFAKRSYSTQNLGQFGSFANDDVEALIRLSTDEFETYYADLVTETGGRAEVILRSCAEREAGLFEREAPAFGRPMRSQFSLELETFDFLNHGAFGAVT